MFREVTGLKCLMKWLGIEVFRGDSELKCLVKWQWTEVFSEVVVKRSV